MDLTLNNLIKVIEEVTGGNVSECSIEQGHIALEIEFYSPAGEDFIFYIDGSTPTDLLQDCKSFIADFDPSDHARTEDGTPGAPELADLIEDAFQIQRILKELGRQLTEIFEQNKAFSNIKLSPEERWLNKLLFEYLGIENEADNPWLDPIIISHVKQVADYCLQYDHDFIIAEEYGIYAGTEKTVYVGQLYEFIIYDTFKHTNVPPRDDED